MSGQAGDAGGPRRPWHPDRVAALEELEAAVATQFPRVAADGLRHLGSRWEFDAWRSTDGGVFRFPRRREAVVQLRREAPILELVRSALAPEVAVPRPELRGEPGPHFPYPFTGRRFLEGVAKHLRWMRKAVIGSEG